jgi:hypothetical protein
MIDVSTYLQAGNHRELNPELLARARETCLSLLEIVNSQRPNT